MDPEPDTWPAPTPRDELLTRIESRGGRLRRRRRTGIAAGVVALVAFVALPFATADDDGSDDEHVGGGLGGVSGARRRPLTGIDRDDRHCDRHRRRSRRLRPLVDDIDQCDCRAQRRPPHPQGPSPSGPRRRRHARRPAARVPQQLRPAVRTARLGPRRRTTRPPSASSRDGHAVARVGEPVTVRVRVRDPDFRIECLVATAGDRALRVYEEVVSDQRPEGVGSPRSGARSAPTAPRRARGTLRRPPAAPTSPSTSPTPSRTPASRPSPCPSTRSASGGRTDLCFGGPPRRRFRESITVTVT